MKSDFTKEWELLIKKENRRLQAAERNNPLKDSLYGKVPAGLRNTLEKAFAKAFRLVFLKGTSVIERTFDRESASMEYEAGNYVIEKAGNRKSIKRLDKTARRSNLLNKAATTATGLGLGILGMGLPDIPLMVGTLLKGIYEIALGYGFSYDTTQEKIYILRLIRTALLEGEAKKECSLKMDEMMNACSPQLPATPYSPELLEEEINSTAKVLSDALLVEKFVQGIPIVGVIGGVVNHVVYAKTAAMAGIKYKKRFLYCKLRTPGKE